MPARSVRSCIRFPTCRAGWTAPRSPASSPPLYDSSSPRVAQAPLSWTRALRQTIAADDHFRSDPEAYLEREGKSDDLEDTSWLLQRAEAELVHRLLGLLGYAANPRNLDLSDHPVLAHELKTLQEELARRPH
ncbi:hypothetical protein ABZ820_22420 [Streptomyces diacarni]|uniref:hypothetical protein n=1 Tax=Streptomyces diacarni TaxID=2800381 RepID=UPI0033CB1625